MLIHKDPFFTIYFGDSRYKFIPALIKQQSKPIMTLDPFKAIKKLTGINEIVFLHQIHGTQGFALDSIGQVKMMKPFTQEGDYLITNVSHLGLAIAHADCLPIILYDTFNQVISVIHAGWRGSVDKVSIKAFERMQKKFDTKPSHVRVYFGPCAKNCCYEVGEEVLGKLEYFPFAHEVIHYVNEKVYFDLPAFNKLQLLECGIKKEAFQISYNLCTICNPSFCSARRQAGGKERQLTFVSLTK